MLNLTSNYTYSLADVEKVCIANDLEMLIINYHSVLAKWVTLTILCFAVLKWKASKKTKVNGPIFNVQTAGIASVVSVSALKLGKTQRNTLFNATSKKSQIYKGLGLSLTSDKSNYIMEDLEKNVIEIKQPKQTLGFEVDRFIETFSEAVKGVTKATDPAKSSQLLQNFCKTKILSYWDMKNNPEKFFLAHRILSTLGVTGFGIRFTVQFNLFAGSIIGLAGPEQLSMVDEIQSSGRLGCFLLTEKKAGVLSGLIVETTAVWDEENQNFILHTPDDSAAKNWISQGYAAELGIVIADLRVKGKSYGPHPFLIELRNENKELNSGIFVEDMGIKTVANDLDNARVSFNKVKMPKSALLTRFCKIENNEYVQVGSEKMRIEVIGQRLMTGRLAISESALVLTKSLHLKAKEYCTNRTVPGLVGDTPLYEIPHIKNTFEKNFCEINKALDYAASVEERLCHCLRYNQIPDDDLVTAIAVAKIKCIDTTVECTHALRIEVGSYSLMKDTGFENTDMFLCCKFAEGDSRILQMKLMRDRLREIRKKGIFSTLFHGLWNKQFQETWTALNLARKFAAAGRDKEDRIFDGAKSASFIEPCVPRFQKMQNSFNENWKETI
eukprot:Pgem_evm1s8019